MHDEVPYHVKSGFGSSLLGVKRPERETDHSPPSSAEVKNAWSYIRILPCLHGVVLNYVQNTSPWCGI
jgi:hypothetical protein